MNIDLIIKNVPPPLNPEYCGTATSWKKIEDEINLVFPIDYQKYISVYGAGNLGDFLFVLNPFLALEGYTYKNHIKEILDAYVTLKQISPRILLHTVFDGETGLYPWLTTDNGDVGYWIVSSKNLNREWPTVVYDSRHSQFEEYNYTCGEFLFKWIKNQLGSHILQPPSSETFLKISEI